MSRVDKLSHDAPIRALRLLAVLLVILGGVDGASAQGTDACSQVATDVNALCLTPSHQSLLLGDSFDVQLDMSFFDSTVGGEVFLGFDSAALSLLSVDFDPNFPDDPDFRCPGSNVNCQPDQIAFGSLSGLSGVFDVLTLTLQSLQRGTHSISLQMDRFSDGVGDPLAVQVIGSSVTVVPEPATSSLVALGLVALTRLRRRSDGEARC